MDDHWEKMPKSWIKTLIDIPPEYLVDLLICPQQKTEKTLWPLSLLALRKLLESLCISRNPVEVCYQIAVRILYLSRFKYYISFTLEIS